MPFIVGKPSRRIGSTRPVREVQGDSIAYHLVRSCQTRVREAVARHQGSVVKTAGESVLAVFRDSLHAVDAAASILGLIGARDLMGASDDLSTLHIGVGLHCGDVLMATENERTDYFGVAIRAAAMLSRQPGVAMTELIYADRGVVVRGIECQPTGDGCIRCARIKFESSGLPWRTPISKSSSPSAMPMEFAT